MLRAIFKRNDATSTVPHQLYGAVVAQARLPVFYTDFGFPDTVMGRFDVLTLHVFLLCHRLGIEEQPNAENLSQEVFDHFVDNLDTALRQLGIGDSSVPKKKKKMVRSFYGQIEDFNDALKSRDLQLLSDAISTRFYEKSKIEISKKLAEYCFAVSDQLANDDIETFRLGRITWVNVSESVK